MPYTPRANYTQEELDSAALRDLLSDATASEEQAAIGPYYPDRGVTAESLLAYAADCRKRAAKLQRTPS